MFKKIFILKLLFIFLAIILIQFAGAISVSAVDKGPTENCEPGKDFCVDSGGSSYDCLPDTGSIQTCKLPGCVFRCQKSNVKNIFGRIQPPPPLAGFFQKDPTGAGTISQFLSNLVALLFTIAAILLIFMLIWGGISWIVSEGDKEKIATARNRIINAIIGIVIVAVAFAAIAVLGTFTGFKLFKGQGIRVERDPATGTIIRITCPKGTVIPVPGPDIDAECENK